MTEWETIVREQAPAVWQTAYRLLGNRSDADDCMQEVFVAAVGISRRTSVQNWPGLLHRLAVLRGIDEIRRRAREPLRSAGAAGLETLASHDQAPDLAAQNGELGAHLRAALASRCGLFRPAVRLPIQVEERDGLIWLKQFAGTAPPAVPPSLSLPAQIVALDGKPVHTVAALRWIANTFAPGSKVALDVASQASTQPARILLVVERVPQ